MTQQQTRTSPKGNGVCWLSLPSSSFATNRPSITSHAFLHSLPFTHFDSVYLFDNEVIGPSLFECMRSWLHCMQLCSCHAYRYVGRWVRLCKQIIHDVFKKFKVSKNMFWRGFFFVFFEVLFGSLSWRLASMGLCDRHTGTWRKLWLKLILRQVLLNSLYTGMTDRGSRGIQTLVFVSSIPNTDKKPQQMRCIYKHVCVYNKCLSDAFAHGYMMIIHRNTR